MTEQVFTNCTLGGPISVYARDGKISRIRPIVIDESNFKPWNITDSSDLHLMQMQGVYGKMI